MDRDCILYSALLSFCFFTPVSLADCYDPEGRCHDPCPAELPCFFDEDCPTGYFCPPVCAGFEYCWCGEENSWYCNTDYCTGQCVPIPVPTGPRGYNIIDLGDLGGLTANALAVNEKGQVVGEADFSTGERHAFLWQEGVMTDLWAGRSGWSYANAINNRSEILVGDLVWRDGALHTLPSYAANEYVSVTAINDLGQIVGGSGNRRVLWSDGSVFDISELRMSISDINNFGHLGGSISLDNGQFHAVVWVDDGIVDLGTLGGWSSGTTEINDSAQAIGVSERMPGGNRHYTAFFWTQGRMIDLALEPSPDGIKGASANGLNNCGEVVGQAAYPYSIASTGHLYREETGKRDLFVMIPAEAKWFRLVPNGINDHGEIVGWGMKAFDVGPYTGLPRAFLMTPQFGDLDTNGMVDLRDFARMQNWFTGDSPPWAPRCLRGDLDRDNDTDLCDFASLRAALNGPQAGY